MDVNVCMEIEFEKYKMRDKKKLQLPLSIEEIEEMTLTIFFNSHTVRWL